MQPGHRSEHSWNCRRRKILKTIQIRLQNNQYFIRQSLFTRSALRHCSPFELDLTLQVLEEDEVLQQYVPPEVAVAELQVHQLEIKTKETK